MSLAATGSDTAEQIRLIHAKVPVDWTHSEFKGSLISDTAVSLIVELATC